MSNYLPTNRHLREPLLLFFNQKKNASESHPLVFATYPEYCPAIRVCQQFAALKSGDFSTEDKERSGRPKLFEDGKLEALLDEDPCQTLKESAESLYAGVTTASERLKEINAFFYKKDSKLRTKTRILEKLACELAMSEKKKFTYTTVQKFARKTNIGILKAINQELMQRFL